MSNEKIKALFKMTLLWIKRSFYFLFSLFFFKFNSQNIASSSPATTSPSPSRSRADARCKFQHFIGRSGGFMAVMYTQRRADWQETGAFIYRKPGVCLHAGPCGRQAAGWGSRLLLTRRLVLSGVPLLVSILLFKQDKWWWPFHSNVPRRIFLFHLFPFAE